MKLMSDTFSQGSLSKSRIILVQLCVLVSFTYAAYLPAMQSGFIWDDDAHITENKLLRSSDGLKKFWVNPKSVPTRQVYPLTFTSFWVEYQLWGDNPTGYHIVNVTLHCLSAILIWLILQSCKIPGAWMAACIFALHPVHVESVAWITERKNVLSGFLYFFSFFTFLQFQKDERKLFYACSLLFFVLALTAKTTACSLPVVVLIYRWWQTGTIGKRDIFLVLPYILVGLPLGLYTIWAERNNVGASGPLWDYDFWERVLIASRAFWFYQFKLLWPVNLTFIYPKWDINVTVWWQWLYTVFFFLVAACLYFYRFRIGRGPFAALAYFLVCIFPALGFFNIYPMRFSFVADHFQYTASLGTIILFSALLTSVGKRLQDPGLLIISLVVFTGLGVQTWRTGLKYENLQTLWEDTLAKNPGVYIAHNDLGVILYKKGMVDKAIDAFRRSIELCRFYPDAHYNLGIAYGKKGMERQAYQEMKYAMQLQAGESRCQ